MSYPAEEIILTESICTCIKRGCKPLISQFPVELRVSGVNFTCLISPAFLPLTTFALLSFESASFEKEALRRIFRWQYYRECNDQPFRTCLSPPSFLKSVAHVPSNRSVNKPNRRFSLMHSRLKIQPHVVMHELNKSWLTARYSLNNPGVIRGACRVVTRASGVVVSCQAPYSNTLCASHPSSMPHVVEVVA